MPDNTATRTGYIETNESTPDAADKYWEVEVSKATPQQGPAEQPFTDNTHSFLRLGTTEQNNVYADLIALDQAVGDKTDLTAAFNAVKAQLQAKASFIDAQLAADRAALTAAIASLTTTKTDLETKKTNLETEKSGYQAQLTGLSPLSDVVAIGQLQAEISRVNGEIKQTEDEIAYFEGQIASLQAEKDALPADTAAIIADLEAKKTAAAQDPSQQAALEAALDAAVAGAKTARRESATHTEKDRGDDLAAVVVDFYDDNRYRGAKGEPQCLLSEAERQNESARIHTKGGWRDHTNGNRISTTRGDKVEVVRGNYSMVVLGRQDDPGMGTTYQSGGGHWARDNDTSTPGAVFEVRWVQDPWSGTWRCIEETTKGDVISRYHGNTEEAWYGKVKKSITGSETQSPIPGDGPRRTGQSGVEDTWISSMSGVENKTNPEVIERTWAKSIDSRTGSSACPVPKIEEQKWAVLVTEVTQLNMHFTTTTILGLEIETTNVAGLKLDHTIVGGANIGMEETAIKLDTLLSGAHLNFDFSLFTLDVFGAALKVEMAMGNKFTVTAISDTELNPEAKEIDALKTKITGVESKIAQSRTSLLALDSKLATQQQELATQKTQINTLYNVMSGSVMLG